MLETVTIWFVKVLAFSKDNPVLAAVGGATMIGSVLRWGLDIPIRIKNLILSNLVISVTIDNRHEGYTRIVKAIETKRIKIFNKAFKLEDPVSNTDRRTLPLSPGMGRSFITYRGKLLRVSRSEQSTTTKEMRDVLVISYMGFSTDLFKSLILECLPPPAAILDDTSITIFKWQENSWAGKEQPKRSLNSVILDSTEKNKIISHIKEFQEEQAWCNDLGIPWKTGIILEGPPGTGKTSLCKALASDLGKSLFVFPAAALFGETLEKALSNVPTNCIFLIEDIDAGGLQNRENKESGEVLNLSGVLNVLDGLTSPQGVILMATTNHIENLDPALIRPGRFDLVAHVGNLSSRTAEEYLTRIFPSYVFGSIRIKEGISPAKLQALCKQYKKHPDKILEEISDSLILSVNNPKVK